MSTCLPHERSIEYSDLTGGNGCAFAASDARVYGSGLSFRDPDIALESSLRQERCFHGA